MNEVLDDTPIRDFIAFEEQLLPESNLQHRYCRVLRLVETIVNLDEQVLGTDAEGHAILGIERESLVGAILMEMKNE